MVTINVDIPDVFVTLYNTRRTTYNVYADANGVRRMPPATRATVERFIRDYMKGLIRNESYRLDPGDNSIIEADEIVMTPV